MLKQGEDTYGKNAYGPNGTMIKTTDKFTVKTEFVSDTSYSELCKMRTRISQGSNEIVMEAGCQDYLKNLSTNIEGGMGFVISSWDNTDSAYKAVEECPDMCSAPAASCENAINQISDFKVYQWGYTEDPTDDPTPEPSPEPEPQPEPQPEPAQMKKFIGEATHYGIWEFYMRGLDGKYLETKDDQIEMGLDNRAFILDYALDDSTYWAFWHYYIGGTLQFDVDVSSVGCECAAGVYLVELNDDYCSWDSKSRGETPQCATIDVMEANQHGFKTQSQPCEFGVCDEESQCPASANAAGTMKYGSGSEYLINT
jgi:hypothetical protein